MRPIDADALTVLLHDDIDGLDEEFPNDKQVKPYMCGVKMALSFIDTAPTVDAVPVVRCKDCKHKIKWNDSFGCAFWGYYGDEFADGEMFCSKGERKDDEDR